MKLLSRISLPLFACLFLFMTACQKENINDGGIITPPDTPEVVDVNPLVSRTLPNGDGIDLGCFSIDLPLGLVDTTGTVYTINTIEDLDNFEGDGIIFVDFVYPLNVTLEDGEMITVANIEELAELFAECLPDGGWEQGNFPAYLINFETSCYTLQYPLDLVDETGETITVEDETEFTGAIAEDLYYFVFPITLLDEEGNTVEVNDNDEIFEALFACNEFDPGDSTLWDWETGFEYIACYMIEFPLDVVLTDGTTVTVETHEELCDLMLAGELANYAYPLTLIDSDGEEVVVNSQEELVEALEDCWAFGTEYDVMIFLLALINGEQNLGCYTISYPFTLEYENQDDIVLESTTDVEDFGTNSTDFDFTLGPITVTLAGSGEEVELVEVSDLYELLSGC